MPQLVKILALDGGGIRGIIPAKILDTIEKRLGEPIAKHFDLITGTSTGGILALGLTVPGDDATMPKFAASELVDLYTTRGRDIFSQPARKRLLDWLPLPVEVDTVFDEKYATAGLERVLEAKFGDAMLSDAVTDVLVTAYGIESRDPWFFSSKDAQDNGGDDDHKMTLVARATSAAPTYFEPLPWHNGHHDALVDGGVFANNPTMCGWAEIVARDRSAETFVVSIGTGSKKQPYPYGKAKNWGLAKWARPILDIVFDGVSATVDYQMNKLLNRPGKPPRYYRLQPDLVEPGVGGMDNASGEHIGKLVKLADEFIARNDATIDEICTALEVFAPVHN